VNEDLDNSLSKEELLKGFTEVRFKKLMFISMKNM
jgi:hypothetical protein